MPSLISKVKDALHGDHADDGSDSRTGTDSRTGKLGMSETDRKYASGTHGQSGNTAGSGVLGAGSMNPTSHSSNTASHLPGSFPSSDQEERSVTQKGYVPPHGTHVGPGQSTSTNDRSEQAITGRDTTGRDPSGRYDQSQPSSGRHEDDHKLMDPADRGNRSNVMGNTAATGAGAAGAGAYGSEHESSHHSKLHKKEDPRGYDQSSSGRDTVGGDPYERQSAQGYAGDNTTKHQSYGQDQYGRQKGQGYDDSSTGKHQGYGNDKYERGHGYHSGAKGAAAAAAAGVGAGGLASSAIPERKHHDTTSAYNDSSNEPYGTSGRDNGLTSGTTGHPGHHSHHQQDYPREKGSSGHAGTYNTVTGHGSGKEYEREAGTGRSQYDAQPGVSSGTGAMARDAVDSRQTSGMGSAAAGGVAGAGAGGPASHYGGRHEDEKYNRATDPISTSEQSGYGSSQQYPSNTTTSSYLQGQTSSQQSSNMPSSGMSGAGTTGQGMTGTSGSHFTPHEGAKVMHACQNCGHDNDISHYFKKDIVYRISQ